MKVLKKSICTLLLVLCFLLLPGCSSKNNKTTKASTTAETNALKEYVGTYGNDVGRGSIVSLNYKYCFIKQLYIDSGIYAGEGFFQSSRSYYEYDSDNNFWFTADFETVDGTKKIKIEGHGEKRLGATVLVFDKIDGYDCGTIVKRSSSDIPTIN